MFLLQMRRVICLLHSQPLRRQWIRRRKRRRRRKRMKKMGRRREKMGGFHDAVSLKEGSCTLLCLRRPP